MQLTLKQLEAFLWVADLGSFRRAAERLNTTQPNISSRISALEELIGHSLMDRDAGSVRLSAKGTELLPLAREIISATERFAETANQRALIKGVLRLGVSEMIVNTWLREFIVLANEHYPQLHIELVVDLSVNLDRELAARSLDLAFHSGPFSITTSGAEPLGIYPFIWVASPKLKLPEKKFVDIDTLASQVILTHARDTKPYMEIQAHFSTLGKGIATLVPSTNMAACQQMAEDGIGIAALPLAMVRKDIGAGHLVQINYRWTPEPLEFMARYDAAIAAGAVGNAARLAQDIAQNYNSNDDHAE